MDCILCKIIKGEIPSYTIYEDEIVKVFLDINPITNGDMLVVPKKHCFDIIDIDLNTLKHINEVSRNMYMLIKEKLPADGLTISQNNGHGHLEHFHVHLTPRYENDNVHFVYSKDKKEIKEVFEILTK